jgi:hypothetical protein
MTLEHAIIIAGILHLCILSAGLVMTKVLDWRTSLAKLEPLTQHIIWTHGSYVWLVILAFGLVSIAWPGALVGDRPLGPAICGFIAVFWGIRLLIQFFYFNASPHLTGLMLKLGYHGLTFCFAFFTAVYGLALARGIGP